MYFPVADIHVFPAVPFITAFVISFFTSMGGVSGAFLLLPFQVSILGFTSPSVSPTNLVYNIIAIPGGVHQYIKEKRMAWPLAWITIAGTLPGVFFGAIIRIQYLPDPKHFKFFAGMVLLYIGLRMGYHMTMKGSKALQKAEEAEKKFRSAIQQKKQGLPDTDPHQSDMETIRFSLTRYTYRFYGETFSFNTLGLFSLALIVGIIGGIYGIGGGAIIAPFFVMFFGLPVYTVAGAALLGTFITSIAGVSFYTVIAPYVAYTGLAVKPDWMLGALLGAGGFAGIYCGAKCQKYMPAKGIKIILACIITGLGVRYVIG